MAKLHRFLAVLVVLAAVLVVGRAWSDTGSVERGRPDPQRQMNVLFIAIDDLRPELGCYGADHIQSPNIDKLASQGVLFERAYCQAPHCGPSRASLLSGVHTRNYAGTPMNPAMLAPDKPTLPAVFRQAGYYTVGNGKIYHQREDDAENSWSEPPFSLVNGPPENSHLTFHDKDSAKYIQKRKNRGPFFEAPDVPDNTYIDGQTCEKTIEDMRRLAKTDRPFFLACGFVRPHLPFYAPKRYWDLYDREKIELANNRYTPKNAPSALRGSGEVHSYHDRDIEYNSTEFHRIARHGYYACVSYADALVGKLLATLDELGLRDNTIVVVWGDHGWNLGEHNFWSKHNLLHNSTNAPLIISAPGFKQNAKTDSIVELLDLYPTLCELAGIDPPKHLQGTSMVPLLRAPDQPGKGAAFTKWQNGLVVTTRDFTYTEYRGNQRMLYDRRSDPDENVNVAESPEYAETVEKMTQLLRKGQEATRNAKEETRVDPKQGPDTEGLIFVDADESNTVAVETGDTSFSTPAANPNGLWRKRPGTGFDANPKKGIYERIAGDPPMLKTTVSGLEPGRTVGVYVCFVSNPTQTWRVRAGFDAEQLALYTPTAPAGNIVDLGAISGAKAHQYLGLVGEAMPSPDGTLGIFVAHGGGNGAQQRTMYEGIVIAPAGVKPQPVAPGGEKGVSVPAAPVYEGDVPVPTLADVRYGEHERHVLDFWQAESDKPTPLVLVIHGGGWSGGSKERLSRFADPNALLKAGISVVAINYRLMKHAQNVVPPVKAPLHDAARALQFVRSKAVEWDIDKTRIGAAGGSAGACSSLWLAYHDDMADPGSEDPVARESTRLQCVAVRGAQTTLDPKQMKEWTPNSRYGGHAFGKKSFDQFLAEREEIMPWIAEYSPYALVSAGDPPVCLFYGSAPSIGEDQKDPTHAANFGVKLRERCQELGIDCKVIYPESSNPAQAPTEYLIAALLEEEI